MSAYPLERISVKPSNYRPCAGINNLTNLEYVTEIKKTAKTIPIWPKTIIAIHAHGRKIFKPPRFDGC